MSSPFLTFFENNLTLSCQKIEWSIFVTMSVKLLTLLIGGVFNGINSSTSALICKIIHGQIEWRKLCSDFC